MGDTPRRPRLWTVVLAFFGILISGQLIAAMVMIGLMALLGWGDIRHAEDAAHSPGALLALIIAGETAWVGLTFLCALASRERVRPLLGLAKPVLPPALWVLAPVGTLGVSVLVMVLSALGLDLSGIKSQLDTATDARGGMALAITICGAVFPAVAEELLFRGLLQRRLAARLGAPAAISITATLFGLAHFDNLPHILVTLAYGVWFGLLAWRTGSIWLGMLCHAVNNAVLFGGAFLLADAEGTAGMQWLILLSAAFLTLGAAAATLALLRRVPRPHTWAEDHPEPSSPNPAEPAETETMTVA